MSGGHGRVEPELFELFSPFQLGSLTLAQRIVIAPMRGLGMRSDYFLISPDAWVSDFCIQYEVGPAAQRCVPVVPVLLRETAHWTKLSLGPQRLLGDFHSAGLPKNDIGNAMPICSDAWGDVDKAWRRMTEDLTVFIAHQLFGPGSRMRAAQAALPATGAGCPSPAPCWSRNAQLAYRSVVTNALGCVPIRSAITYLARDG